MRPSRTSVLTTILCGAAGLAQVASAGFFRMSCNAILHGRVDPIINNNMVASHVHKVSGGYNFGVDSDFDDLIDSKCTSCELTADRSAYWTPLLYYQFKNGSFTNVPSGGHVVYYLGRGDNLTNTVPFPKGFQMVSGNNGARSYDSKTMTWNNRRPQADRVSFACIQSGSSSKATPGLNNTRCSNGLRAQIHFQSCWDGKNVYKPDMSHVAYLSAIDNGSCPPTHPYLLPHIFFEVYYSVSSINQDDGGRFVFANGDTTGYGFHGDFQNGWDPDVQQDAVTQCIVGPNSSGSIDDCAPLAAVDSDTYGRNCPERPPLVNEQIFGVLSKLPGCNPPTSTEAEVAKVSCSPSATPTLNSWAISNQGQQPVLPVVGQKYNGWTYLGMYNEPKPGRVFKNATISTSTMTVDFCISFCDGKNWNFAGVEYGRECYCGNSTGTNQPTSDVSASNSMICVGNGSQFCGGSSRIMIYQDTTGS